MPINDPHGGRRFPDSAEQAVAVTPADADLPFIPTFVYVGGTGNLVVMTKDGTVVTFAAVPAGTQLRLRPLRILPASTATNIVACA